MQEINSKKKVEEFFDVFAKERELILSTPSAKHIYQDMILRIVREAGLTNSDYILDAGCGSGEHLVLLEDMGFKNLYGFDISEEMVRIACMRCQHAEIEKGDIENLDYPPDFFDAVIAVTVLMFPTKPIKGLIEIRKVLKKGGKLIIVNPNLKGGEIKNLIARKGKINTYSQPWNRDFKWSIKETKKLVEESGYKILYAKCYGFILSKCPENLLQLNILLDKVLEKTFLSNFGKEVMIIAEKI